MSNKSHRVVACCSDWPSAHSAPCIPQVVALSSAHLVCLTPCVSYPVWTGAEVASASLQGFACARYGVCMRAACDYATVERVNCRSVHPLLAELVAQPFFRYFKVNLYCDCPFWPDDGMCMLRDCSVCECDDGEVPALWLAQDRPAATDAAASAACQGALTG